MKNKQYVIFIFFILLSCTSVPKGPDWGEAINATQSLLKGKGWTELKVANLSFKEINSSEFYIERTLLEREECEFHPTLFDQVGKLKSKNSNIVGFSNLKVEYYMGADPTREVNCMKVSGYPILKGQTK